MEREPAGCALTALPQHVQQHAREAGSLCQRKGGQGRAPRAGTILAWSSPMTLVVTWFMSTTCPAPSLSVQGSGVSVAEKRVGFPRCRTICVCHPSMCLKAGGVLAESTW